MVRHDIFEAKNMKLAFILSSQQYTLPHQWKFVSPKPLLRASCPRTNPASLMDSRLLRKGQYCWSTNKILLAHCKNISWHNFGSRLIDLKLIQASLDYIPSVDIVALLLFPDRYHGFEGRYSITQCWCFLVWELLLESMRYLIHN